MDKVSIVCILEVDKFVSGVVTQVLNEGGAHNEQNIIGSSEFVGMNNLQLFAP